MLIKHYLAYSVLWESKVMHKYQVEKPEQRLKGVSGPEV